MNSTAKVTFGSLKVGAQFSLVSDPEARHLYANVKVHPAVMVGREEWGPYNVISLSKGDRATGEPRTFNDKEMVYPL